MCGHLDFLWPFASQKKQTNVAPDLSNLDVCSRLAVLFGPDLGVSTGFGIAALGAAALADILIAAT